MPSLPLRAAGALLALTGLAAAFVLSITPRDAHAQPAATSPLSPPPNGPRHAEPTFHTITNATIHVAPGKTIAQGALVIRDGKIVSVVDYASARFAPPEGSRVWDCTGLHIYPGFIDPYVEVDAPRPAADDPAAHWNPRVTPQRSALEGDGLDDRTAESLRKLGFTAAAISPRGGIFRGQSAVVSLAKPSDRRSADRPAVYNPSAYQSVAFDLTAIRPGASAAPAADRPRRAEGDAPDVARWSDYPNSQMGAIALIRQTLSDADWQSSARQKGAAPAPSALDALAPASAARPAAPLYLFSTEDELEALRAAKIAKEFNRPAALLGSGTEFRRLDAITQNALPIVLPLNYPRVPDVSTVGRADAVELRDLMTWEQAPTNPRRLDAAGLPVSLTTAKLRDRAQFRENLTKAMRHGLPPDRALAMLTTNPAKLLGVEDRLGTIEPAKAASLIIADGDLFQPWPAAKTDKKDTADEKKDDAKKDEAAQRDARPPASEPKDPAAQVVDARPQDRDEAEGERRDPAEAPDAARTRERDRKQPKIRDVWIDGQRHELTPAPDKSAQGTWVLTEIDGKPIQTEGDGAVRLVVSEDSVTYLKGDKRARAKAVKINGPRVSYTLDAKDLFDIDATLVDDATVSGDQMLGVTPMPNGSLHRWTAKRLSASTEVPPAPRAPRTRPEPKAEPKPDADKPDAEKPDAKPDEAKPEAKPADKKPAPRKTPEQEERDAIAQIPDALGLPFGPYALAEEPAQPDVLIIANATIWTANDKREIIEKGHVVVRKGKIDAVAKGDAPAIPGAVVIDAAGKHLAPGIIDTHSHTGISKGVNEAGRAVTAEVRLGDVTDPDAISWYRQLAGGVTAVQSLHGSANAIGGQAQVNKIRWGTTHPDGMHFTQAKPGIKFALGENPRQANWGDRQTVRYPQTRMGVEALIRDRFTAAREYLKARNAPAAGPASLPHRRDLELDALAEILAGERLVHCHSYRQDEILMLCRVAQEYGFKIGTFQHILEGYKVADDIAKTALGASGFTDWWAFKIEVQDAIPQGFPIMHEQGVVVSYNSDSDELARRLNSEAGKAVKYGTVLADDGSVARRVEPGEAIRWVTKNAAIQIGAEKLTGSIEPGKDADLALWSGDPLQPTSRCEATWIDGRQYFSLEQDARHREQIQKERHRLLQKALAATGRDRAPSGGSPDSGGITGPWSRPTDVSDEDADRRRGMLQRRYLDMINRSSDPNAARPGECGCYDIYMGP